MRPGEIDSPAAAVGEVTWVARMDPERSLRPERGDGPPLVRCPYGGAIGAFQELIRSDVKGVTLRPGLALEVGGHSLGAQVNASVDSGRALLEAKVGGRRVDESGSGGQVVGEDRSC